MEKSSKLFYPFEICPNKTKMAKEEKGERQEENGRFLIPIRIHHRAERAERNRCFSSSQSSARLVTRNGVDFAYVLPETVDAALWPVDRANDRRKILFFFPFSPYFFLLLLLSFLFFSASLDPLQALESVLASNSRLEYLGERGSVYISFPFVTSFDSLIQYRFSIASQRIFLEGRRIRNSLFSR